MGAYKHIMLRVLRESPNDEAAPITRWLFSLATLHTMLSISIMAFRFDDQPPNPSRRRCGAKVDGLPALT
jgi:hypothetical protein